MPSRVVTLLTRAGCDICRRAADTLAALAGDLRFEFVVADVDARAAAGDDRWRAEYGDRLPVVLLDGCEHSFWEVDEPRLRRDLAGRGASSAPES